MNVGCSTLFANLFLVDPEAFPVVFQLLGEILGFFDFRKQFLVKLVNILRTFGFVRVDMLKVISSHVV
jgi:hypothetical protein